MQRIYIITFKDPKSKKKFYFTSLKALSMSFTQENFGVKPSYIKELRFKNEMYKNDHIIIKRVVARRTSDVGDKPLSIY